MTQGLAYLRILNYEGKFRGDWMPNRINTCSWVVLSLLGLVLAPAARAAIFVVDSLGDFDDDNLGDGLCATFVPGGGGLPTFRCSLRGAIQQANASPGPDRIEFAVAGRITLPGADSALPTITETLTIDGSTAPGAPAINGNEPAAPVVIIDGSNLVSASDGFWGLEVDATANDTRIHNLAIVNVPGDAIAVVGSESTWISGCWLGVDPDVGTAAANARGIFLDATSTTIGHTIAGNGRGNVISGNRAQGINGFLNFGVVRGNRIGVDAAGSNAIPNQDNGIVLFGNQNDIGRANPTPSQVNVIAANIGDNIELNGDQNLVRGNRIGCSLGAPLTNNARGIRINGNDNTVGGDPQWRNEFCDHQMESILASNAPDVTISDNLVRDGASRGIIVQQSSNATVNGNEIIDNTDIGIFFVGLSFGEASFNTINGNGDGIRFSGTTLESRATDNMMSGNFRGFQISGQDHFIANNTVLDSRREAIDLFGATGNLISRNRIGGTEGPGIVVGEGALNNGITENQISGDFGPAIDLGDDGPTINDPGDADDGSNRLQNSPELVLISFTPGNGSEPPLLEIELQVDSDAANSAFPLLVEFFYDGAATSNPLGAIFLNNESYSTPQMVERITLTLPGTLDGATALVSGQITATATDLDGNTSELSAPIRFGLPEEIFSDGFESP